MDYKSELIQMIENIPNDKMIEYIYKLIKGILDKYR